MGAKGACVCRHQPRLVLLLSEEIGIRDGPTRRYVADEMNFKIASTMLDGASATIILSLNY